ncbi:hypothetical protein JCM6882_005375 [Rhodosporidiobolus microsporus]
MAHYSRPRSRSQAHEPEWSHNDDVLHTLLPVTKDGPPASPDAELLETAHRERREARQRTENSSGNRRFIKQQREKRMEEEKRQREEELRRERDPNYGTPFGQHDWHHSATQTSGLEQLGNAAKYFHNRAKESYIPGARKMLGAAHAHMKNHIFARRPADAYSLHSNADDAWPEKRSLDKGQYSYREGR